MKMSHLEVFFHYFFPNSAIISATDGAPRIFAHHLMLRCDSNPDTTANRPLTTHPDNSSPTTGPLDNSSTKYIYMYIYIYIWTTCPLDNSSPGPLLDLT